MALVDRLFRWLADGPTPAADAILGAALVQAEPEYYARLSDLLRQRDTDAAWAGLIGTFERWSAAQRESMREPSAQMRSGLGAALRSSIPTCRVNALAAFGAFPQYSLTYLLADALRDGSARVREVAAETLVAVAAGVSRDDSGAPTDGEAGAVPIADRREVAAALREALRTFELHHRVEILRACLWLARDLGEPLWAALSSPRSPCGLLVSDRLAGWNEPRLASFLLLALPRLEWRPIVQRQLAGWRAPAEVVALLRQSDLLADAQVRQNLRYVRRPAWFSARAADVLELPPELRAVGPRWACYLGFSEEERLDLLSGWLRVPDEEVQRAAVYALAALGSPAALSVLEQIAAEATIIATFARWYLRGREQSVTSGAGSPSSPSGIEDESRTAARVGGSEFSQLWGLCRRAWPDINDRVVAILRENADLWHWRLVACLRSADPRERLLTLRVLDSPALAARFRGELSATAGDSVEAVRRAAGALLGSAGDKTSGAHSMPAPAATAQAPAETRARLRALLAQLTVSDGSSVRAEAQIREVGELLRVVRTEVRGVNVA